MPDLICLMLTSFADDEALFASVMAGAAGYVLKQIKAHDLITDVHRVAAGESLFDARSVARVVERISNPPRDRPRNPGSDAQERRILDLIAEGQTNRQIAESMFLAEHTVKTTSRGFCASSRCPVAPRQRCTQQNSRQERTRQTLGHAGPARDS